MERKPTHEIQGLTELVEARMPLFVHVLSLKDLQESIFHKIIKEATLTMQTKAGWEM